MAGEGGGGYAVNVYKTSLTGTSKHILFYTKGPSAEDVCDYIMKALSDYSVL